MTTYWIRTVVELEVEADSIEKVRARWQEKTVFDMLDAGAAVWGSTIHDEHGEELCVLETDE